MICPYCNSDTKVIDKRGDEINRRRRECLNCGQRFTTYERIEAEGITKIKKRNGRIVPFEQEKITTAIWKAAKAVGGTDKELAKQLSDKVVKLINERFKDEVPDVETIQDLVEKTLSEEGHYKTAKAYILYRQQHKELREQKNFLDEVNNIIDEYMDKTDWRVKENANEQFSFSGLLLHTSGKVIVHYALNKIYTPQIKDAFEKGYFHIHDLSHGFIGYCAGWSLKNLLLLGFGGVPNKIDANPAKHLGVVVHQMVNYIGCLQMEFAGAQAFSSVDTLLAPFVRVDNLNYKEVKQEMQKLVFSLNVPSRWGSQFPFSNLTFDWVVPDDMKNEKAVVGGKRMDFAYGDCQKEMDMVNKAFIELMLEGDANGRLFSFPIPTYNLTKDFEWDSENADLLFEMTAKYGTPYFQNYIGSDLDPKSIRAMCCRLNMDLKQLTNRPGHSFAAGDNTGSIGVVTINVNRLAYESKKKEEYFDRMSYYMELAKESLEIKRKVLIKNLEAGLMPYTKRYLGTWRNHFSTIGLVGMNEACLNFLGKDISSKEGKEFTIETLNFMRKKLIEFQGETGNLYNLEATPAEGACYSLAKKDKKYCPSIITAGENEPYLTNSTHLPVSYTEDAISAIEHQNDIQHLYTGGTVFHTFMGEKMSSGESCKRLVKKIAYNTKLPYITITPTFSICKEHKYIAGEHFNCPKCGKETEVFSRIVGYYRPVQNWHAGKQEEFKERLEYCEEKTLKHEFKTKIEKAIEVAV